MDAKSAVKGYVLGPRPLIQPRGGVEASITTGFGTAVGQGALIMYRHAVDVDRPRLNLLGKAQSSPQILREDGRCQPVLGVVGDANGLLLGLDVHDRNSGSERFSLVNVHVGGDVVDDNGPQPRVAALLRLRISVEDGGAALCGIRDELLVLLSGSAADENGGFAVGWEHGGDCGGQLLSEGVLDGLVDEDSLRGHADLAAVDEGAEGAVLGGKIQVGVLPHDGGGLAAQLQYNGLEMLSCQLGNGSADLGAAGKIDLLDARVGDE